MSSFERNRSEQFEERMIMVEIVEPADRVQRHGGFAHPAVTAHGEGRALCATKIDRKNAIAAARFMDSCRKVTDTYPLNPNGSPEGITGLTTADGRFTVLMEHPERVFGAV